MEGEAARRFSRATQDGWQVWLVDFYATAMRWLCLCPCSLATHRNQVSVRKTKRLTGDGWLSLLQLT